MVDLVLVRCWLVRVLVDLSGVLVRLLNRLGAIA